MLAMKEKILWGVGVAVSALLLRQGIEWFISDAQWPQYAKDAGLFLFQNPVMWTICGGVGAFAGWHVPEAYAEQERGSTRVVVATGALRVVNSQGETLQS